MGIFLWLLPTFFVYGQMLDPVSFSINSEKIPSHIEPGVPFFVTMEAAIDKDWHLYSLLNDDKAGPIPTTFSSVSERMIIAGDIKESEVERVFDPNFNNELGWHSQSAIFQIPVAIDALPGTEFQIDLLVRYQVCDDKSCLPPKKKKVSTMISLAESSGPAEKIDFSAGDFGKGTGVEESVYSPDDNNEFINIVALVVLILSFGIVAGYMKKTGKFSIYGKIRSF